MLTTQTISFSKYHALGNDYLVIDPRHVQGAADDGSIPFTKRQIQLICDRHRGIGSDGILWGPFKKNGSIALRIFNPDGSEAEKSGNGVRIFSRYLRDAGYTKGSFDLATLGGTVRVDYLGEDRNSLIRVAMGKAQFDSKRKPGDTMRVGGKSLKTTVVSMGNPHCVIRVTKPTEQMCRKLGPLVERHRWFPRRTNVQFVQVLSRKRIRIEIWERGAGYTTASGSSSCAAVAAALWHGWVDREVEVQMPGGVLKIRVDESGMVWMTGPVTAVATGKLDIG